MDSGGAGRQRKRSHSDRGGAGRQTKRSASEHSGPARLRPQPPSTPPPESRLSEELQFISGSEQLWRSSVRRLSSESAQHCGGAIAAHIFMKYLNLYKLAANNARSDESQHVRSHGGFTHHLHGVLRAHKALLKMDLTGVDGCSEIAKSLRQHTESLRSKARAGCATEQALEEDIESLLHGSMEEHCWGAIADVAKELQEWSTQCKAACSAEVSAQLHALKQRYAPP